MPVYLAYGRNVVAMKEIVNGTEISYRIEGEGENRVLLLHGWGCDMKLMQPVADVLKKDHRTLVIDFPGHGESGNEARVHVHQPEQADPVRFVKNGVAHRFAQGLVSAGRRYEGCGYSQSYYDDGYDYYESQFFSLIHNIPLHLPQRLTPVFR